MLHLSIYLHSTERIRASSPQSSKLNALHIIHGLQAQLGDLLARNFGIQTIDLGLIHEKQAVGYQSSFPSADTELLLPASQ